MTTQELDARGAGDAAYRALYPHLRERPAKYRTWREYVTHLEACAAQLSASPAWREWAASLTEVEG